MRAGLACRWAGLITAVLLVAGAARAVPVTPGETVFVPGATLAERPDLAGTDLYGDQLTVRIGHPVAPSLFIAWWDVRQIVVRSDETGTLVFSTQLIWGGNITPGNFLVDAIWLDGWGDFATDVVYRTDLSGDRGPSWASRSADGQRLEMDFGFPLFSGNLVGDPQESGMPIQLVTDARRYATTGVLTVVGRFADQPGERFIGRIEGLAVPVATPVPEPAAWALWGLGLLVMGAAGRRRNVGVSCAPKPQ